MRQCRAGVYSSVSLVVLLLLLVLQLVNVANCLQDPQHAGVR
jgi:hypothetical protein